MRRQRRTRPEHVDAKVILQCPIGHELGYVIVSDSDPSRLRPGRGTGWQSLEPLEVPLAMTCHECESRGHRFDLRGSWEKVRAVARELHEDRTRSKVVYRLGG